MGFRPKSSRCCADKARVVLRTRAFVAAAAAVFAFSHPSVCADSRYQKKILSLQPDPLYGQGTDWKAIIFNPNWLTAAADGSVFVADRRENAIFKFDPTGRLVQKFGKKGQGPGDFIGPTDMSILDGRYLVVGEYALNHRISLFDLQGNFVKLLQTKGSTFNLTALKNGKVAYTSHQYNTPSKKTVKVRIIDTTDGRERDVYSVELDSRQIQAGGMTLGGGEARIFLASDPQGNVWVALDDSLAIKRFSPEGRELSGFRLSLTPLAVTDRFLKAYSEDVISDLAEGRNGPKIPESSLAALRHADWRAFFGKSLALFHDFYSNEKGELLVFVNNGIVGPDISPMQVYGPEGELLNECTFDTDSFEFGLNRTRKLAFTANALYALVYLKGGDETEIRLIKVDI
jgi:hypothetical protein